MRSRGIFLVPILLAAALRFPGLASRPMHADEAVHADKFGTLLEGGGYAYDPSEYHGPTLYYLTLPSAWLQGARRYVDIDEVTLRAVPALLGVALVAAHLGARAFLGNKSMAWLRSHLHEIPHRKLYDRLIFDPAELRAFVEARSERKVPVDLDGLVSEVLGAGRKRRTAR